MRKKISLTQKLASALSGYFPHDLRKELRERKATAEEVFQYFEWHHNIFYSMGGSDLWWNLTPLLSQEHKDRFKRDIQAIAKTKRNERNWRDFMRRIEAGQKPRKRPTKRRWPSRAISNLKRPQK